MLRCARVGGSDATATIHLVWHSKRFTWAARLPSSRAADVGHASRLERATMGSVASVYSSRRVPFSGSSISCPPCMRRMHRAPNCAGRLFYRPTVGSLGTLQCCPVAFTRYSVCLRGATHRIGVDGCAYRFKVHCAHQDGVCTQREARNTACDTYSNWLKTCSSAAASAAASIPG